MKEQTLHSDYTRYPRNYQLKIVSEYKVLIPADESVRLLSEVMEDLDYTRLYRAYARVGRKPKTSSTAMFKVLVYGAMEGNAYEQIYLDRLDGKSIWTPRSQT